MKKSLALFLCFAFLLSALFSSCDKKETPVLSDQAPQSSYTPEESPAPEEIDPRIDSYREALRLLEAGELEAAYDIFLTIKDFRNVNDYLECFSFKYDVEIEKSPTGARTHYYEYDEYGKSTLCLRFGTYASTERSVYEYDENENLNKKVYNYKYNDWQYEEVSLYEYDDNGNVTRYTDPRGDVTELEYDSNGNVIKKITKNTITEYSYDSRGNILKCESKKNGITTSMHTYAYEYDSEGRCIRILHAYDFSGSSGHILRTNKYDEKGNLIKEQTDQSNGLSYYSEYEYDGQGRKIKQVSYFPYSGLATVSYKYDENGNMTEQHREDKSGRDYSYLYEYDSAGNCVKESYTSRSGDTSVTTYEYDKYGNLLKRISHGETDSPDDYNITIYMGYKLYYNPYTVKELPPELVGKG